MQIGLIALYTNDQEAGIAFYRDRLGFEVIADAGDENYRWVEVARPGAEMGIVLAMPTSDTDQAMIGKQGLIYFVDDVQAVYDDLVAKGVPFHTPPTTEFWGRLRPIQGPRRRRFSGLAACGAAGRVA